MTSFVLTLAPAPLKAGAVAVTRVTALAVAGAALVAMSFLFSGGLQLLPMAGAGLMVLAVMRLEAAARAERKHRTSGAQAPLSESAVLKKVSGALASVVVVAVFAASLIVTSMVGDAALWPVPVIGFIGFYSYGALSAAVARA